MVEFCTITPAVRSSARAVKCAGGNNDTRSRSRKRGLSALGWLAYADSAVQAEGKPLDIRNEVPVFVERHIFDVIDQTPKLIAPSARI